MAQLCDDSLAVVELLFLSILSTDHNVEPKGATYPLMSVS